MELKYSFLRDAHVAEVQENIDEHVGEGWQLKHYDTSSVVSSETEYVPIVSSPHLPVARVSSTNFHNFIWEQ
jgi:hypothetical protein